MEKRKCEIEHWENIKSDMKYPKEDNNEGYVYGIYLLDGDDIIDVEWFKTDEERFKAIRKYKLEVVNSMDYYSD